MKRAFVFPGQASQFPGMGKDLYESSPHAVRKFHLADEILGFKISEVMFHGSEEDLRQTNVTQPAVFLHSVIKAEVRNPGIPDAVAGHSLGEFSALVFNRVLSFEDGLRLVQKRSEAMQKACEAQPGTMAAIMGLDDARVEELCADSPGVVVAANYNCPGQLVISGEITAVQEACRKMTDSGAKRALILPVGGAFHSPLMEPALNPLREVIDTVLFHDPVCPIYQNVDGLPQIDPSIIRQNLTKQLVSPVRWTQTIQQMTADGFDHYLEIGGTGKVLSGMIKRINNNAQAESL